MKLLIYLHDLKRDLKTVLPVSESCSHGMSVYIKQNVEIYRNCSSLVLNLLDGLPPHTNYSQFFRDAVLPPEGASL